MKRENGTGRARRFIVPVMQIDALPLRVRHSAGLVARQIYGRAQNSELTDDGQQRCQQP